MCIFPELNYVRLVLPRLIERLEERIGGPLLGNGCGWPVTGIHFNVAGKFHKLLHYAHDLLVVVSPIDIGASYRAGEKGVAAEKNLGFLAVKANATGGMARVAMTRKEGDSSLEFRMTVCPSTSSLVSNDMSGRLSPKPSVRSLLLRMVIPSRGERYTGTEYSLLRSATPKI